MFQAIGIVTKTVYASGSRSECLQALNDRFPSYAEKKSNYKVSKKALGTFILPEPVRIERVCMQ